MTDTTTVRFAVEGEGLDRALRLLASFGVRNLNSQPPTLEELFLRHYQTEHVTKSGPDDKDHGVSR